MFVAVSHMSVYVNVSIASYGAFCMVDIGILQVYGTFVCRFCDKMFGSYAVYVNVAFACRFGIAFIAIKAAHHDIALIVYLYFHIVGMDWVF